MPTSDVIAEVSLALSYPEPLRATGPLPSLVLRTEDMCQKNKPFFIAVFGILTQGFPILCSEKVLNYLFETPVVFRKSHVFLRYG